MCDDTLFLILKIPKKSVLPTLFSRNPLMSLTEQQNDAHESTSATSLSSDQRFMSRIIGEEQIVYYFCTQKIREITISSNNY